MLVFLCAFLFLPSALSFRYTDLPSRDDYLRAFLNNTLEYVPPNDVEIWLGWRRIYMGENILPNMLTWKFSLKFGAPPDRLSTVVRIGFSNKRSSCFLGVAVNVPGDDVGRGEELRPLSLDIFFGGKLAFLVFPQNQRLDGNAANGTLNALDNCTINGFQTALHLDRVDAITVYEKIYHVCGDKQRVHSDEDTPKWESLRQNLGALSYLKFFVTPPDGVVEVEYLEGVSLRMGNCLPVFLTLSPPRSVKFAATAGTYYTLCFVDLGMHAYSCRWLLVNIPEGDFSRGVEIVPYSPYTDDSQVIGQCVYLLYSQGKNKMAASEVTKLSPLTPQAISNRFSLGDPVAANFYGAYWSLGPLPRSPSVPATALVTNVRGLSSTPPPTPRLTSSAEVTTTTQKAESTRLQNGVVCVAVAGLLILVQVPIPALDFA